MTKRPKDMTAAELESLPVGPYVEKTEDLTAEDYAQGRVGKTKTTMEIRETRLAAYQPDDMLAWTDSVGAVWGFGQWADGAWYKTPSPFGVIAGGAPQRKPMKWGKSKWGEPRQ